MFFKRFDQIDYKLDGVSKATMNIVTAAILKRLNVDRNYIFQKYVVKEGETIDMLAHRLYKDPTLGWTILLVNGMVDPFNEWTMDLQTLEDYTVAKYGTTDTIVEFRYIDSGWILDDIEERDVRELIENSQPIPINVFPLTALELETERNNERRQITLVSPRYIRQFVDEFYKAIA